MLDFTCSLTSYFNFSNFDARVLGLNCKGIEAKETKGISGICGFALGAAFEGLALLLRRDKNALSSLSMTARCSTAAYFFSY